MAGFQVTLYGRFWASPEGIVVHHQVVANRPCVYKRRSTIEREHKVSLRLGRWKSFVRSGFDGPGFSFIWSMCLDWRNVNESLSHSTCVQCDNIGL